MRSRRVHIVHELWRACTSTDSIDEAWFSRKDVDEKGPSYLRRNTAIKGKPWTPSQEKQLRRLLKDNDSVDVIAVKLNKSPEAIRKKIERLGLEVVDHKGSSRTTTSLKIPKELPTVEETLKMLAGALNAAMLPGLDKVEVQRLQTVARLAKTYKDLFSDYVDYRGIEGELVELRGKYEDLVKKVQNPPAKPNSN